jgi:hypothetical protein
MCAEEKIYTSMCAEEKIYTVVDTRARSLANKLPIMLCTTRKAKNR